MAESLDINNLYDTVSDGKWTIDLFNQCCTEAVADLDGNGKPGEVSDRFGLISGSGTYNSYFLFGAGCTYSKENSDGTHALSINNDHTVSVIERFDKSLFDSNTVIYNDDLLAKKAPDSESAEILRMMYDHLVFDVFATFQVGISSTKN